MTARPGGMLAEVLGRIEESGPLSFAEFMEIALYSEDGGYYMARPGPWGRGGDYMTSTDVSAAFARVMAEAVREAWEVLGRPGSFTLIEAGAGRGDLAGGIAAALREREPGLYEALEVVLVERSPAGAGPGTGRTRWAGELPGPGSVEAGVILSNELLDSLPFHRVVFEGGRLWEVYVAAGQGGRLVDRKGPLSDEALSEYFRDAGLSLEEGQRAEVNLLAGPWIERAAAVLGRGLVITIDYGLPARELYGPERMGGTLACHYRQAVNYEPYERVGLQDITSHVDFSNLVRRGRAAGLRLRGFTTQKNFLIGLGVLDELLETDLRGPEAAGRVAHNRAIAGLIAPGGMGDAFKVLVQEKGGPEERRLRGFSFRDMSRFL